MTMGFSDAESQTPDQQFTLSAKDYSNDIALKFVKFQHVDKVTIFIEDNYGAPQTEIQKLEIWGCPAKGTNVYFEQIIMSFFNNLEIAEGICQDSRQNATTIIKR